MNRMYPFLAALAAFAVAPSLAATSPVATKSGAVQGVDKDGITSWLGIPFAAPPVGDLRWRAPQPAASWAGVRPADQFGPACTQNHEHGAPAADQKVSEDCLYLNVWAQEGHPAAKRPVMVYIYGGGFNIGSTAWPQTDGTSLARHGVVLVSVGYRLGKFGFFAHPALTAEAKGAPIGNYGVLDMIAGLQWVKANIASFGGDPGNVTVFGESAGGAAVHMLMTSPLAHGLFEKAIVESGGPFPMKDLTAAEADGTAAAATWGVTGNDLAAFRALPADKVLGKATMSQGGSSPMVDGKVVPQDVLAAYRAGAIAHVPIMIGTNSYEAGLFPMMANGVKESYAAEWPRITALYDGYGTGKPELVAGQLVTDQRFTAPGRTAALAAAATGNPTYVYSFNYLRPSQRGKVPGALHFDEIYAVFGTEPTAPGADANDPVLVEAVESRWTGFAATGVPAKDWPRLRAGDQSVLVFSNDGVTVEKDYLKARLDLDAVLPAPPRS